MNFSSLSQEQLHSIIKYDTCQGQSVLNLIKVGEDDELNRSSQRDW